MNSFIKDIPLYLNGFFAGLLLTTDTDSLSVPRLIFWGCICLTIVWYGYNMENSREKNEQKRMNKEEFVTHLLNKRKEDKSKPIQTGIVRTEYPNNLIHIRDTDENREIVRSILGDPLHLWDRSYIVVNVVDGTWYTDFAYRYLYCDQPDVIDVKELNSILKTH